MKRLLMIILLLGYGLALTSCAAVQPWQRGQLADPIMIFNENPIEAGMKEHYLDYREGSSGGTGSQSGGCGC